MITREVIDKILRSALSKGADFADVYLEEKATNIITAEDGKIETVSSGSTIGAGIRAISGDAVGFSSIDSIDEASMIEAAGIAAKIAKDAKTQGVSLKAPTGLKRFADKSTFVDKARIDEKADKLKAASRAAWGLDGRIKQVTVSYADQVKSFWLADSNGTWVSDARPSTRLAVHIVAAEGASVQTGYEGPGALEGFEFFNSFEPEEIAQKAARRALAMLAAKPAPTGEMPVLLEEGYGGVLLHEACGHGLEADLVLKSASVFAGKIGQQVASSVVTAVDDPTIPGWWGSYGCDDEGVQSRKNVLIENGVLAKYLHSRETARKMAQEPTGNGRRQSYRHIPIPRMSNTYIAPGQTAFDDMVASIDFGFYAKALGGGQVNTVNGDFVFGVDEGYMIEKGRITHAVRGATLIGNGLNVLMDVEAVGKNLSAKPGFCGKDGQSVPVTTGQPAIKIRRMTIGGTSL